MVAKHWVFTPPFCSVVCCIYDIYCQYGLNRCYNIWSPSLHVLRILVTKYVYLNIYYFTIILQYVSTANLYLRQLFVLKIGIFLFVFCADAQWWDTKIGTFCVSKLSTKMSNFCDNQESIGQLMKWRKSDIEKGGLKVNFWPMTKFG